MPIIVNSILPVDAQAARLGYKIITEEESKEQLPYSVMIESARKNLPADHPERVRIERDMRKSQKYSEHPLIELTERDFKSDRFLQSLAHVCKCVSEECRKLNNMGRLNAKTELAKMWRAGEIEEHYIKVQGAFCHFKKSKLPRARRILVETLFNDAIEHYRRSRNARARANYKRRKTNMELKEQGITNVEAHIK